MAGYKSKWSSSHEHRNHVLLISIGVTVLLLVVLGAAVFAHIRAEEIDGAGQTLSRQNWYLTRDGEKRQIRDHLKILLVAGIDTFDSDVTSYFGTEAWVNQTQADMVMLLVFDLMRKTVTPIQLNRDTMCDVYRIKSNGKVSGTNYEQLALSHTYGSGGDDSARNIARTVSKLLFGAPMDSYVAFNMPAVPVINDMVGGVSVTLTEDLTELDPSFTAGATVTLRGEQALSFVRTREHDPVDANVSRMSRQRRYLTSLLSGARAALSEDPDIVTESFDEILPYMVTDLSINSYADYVNWMNEFTVGGIVTAEGEYTAGKQWAEFRVDQDSLWNLAVSAFCK